MSKNNNLTEKQKKAVARIMNDHNIIYIGKRLTKEEEDHIVAEQ